MEYHTLRHCTHSNVVDKSKFTKLKLVAMLKFEKNFIPFYLVLITVFILFETD